MFKVWKEMSLFVLIICIAITVYNIDREIENFIITKQGIEAIGIVSKKVRESEDHLFYLMVQFQDINRVKQKAKIYVDRPTYKQIKKNKPIAIKYKQNLLSRIVAFKYPSYWQNNINVYGKISILAGFGAFLFNKLENVGKRKLKAKLDRAKNKNCQELEAIELDSWREYTLLKIDKEIDIEPIHLLKMTSPSTGYIHVLRVPPSYTGSAREAIKWVNRGIDPEEFTIET